MSMGTQFHRIGARGPRYACTLDGVACQAVQDFFEITAPATSDVRIREIKIGQYTDFGDAHSDLVSIVVRTGYTNAGLRRLDRHPGQARSPVERHAVCRFDR
jgi:hypothetical protein